MTERVAIIIPGAQFGPFTPLLMYAGEAAYQRQAREIPVTWPVEPTLASLAEDVRGPWVCDQVRPVLDEVAPGTRTLLIGKSLGTSAAALAAERDLPAVWITPLLNRPFVVDALRRANAPCLLVGGTADRTWDPDLARELSDRVLEIDGADHGLFVPGPLAASAATLGHVATAIEEFLDDTVWPVTATS